MTSILLFGGIGQAVYGLLLFLTSLLLILLVLVQRGRGGGLSGAFGGMGGQSAFGAKAGDTFTKITIGAASFWIVLCLIGVRFMGGETMASKFSDPQSATSEIDAGEAATGATAGDAAAEVQDESAFESEVANPPADSAAAGEAAPAAEGSLSAPSSDDS